MRGSLGVILSSDMVAAFVLASTLFGGREQSCNHEWDG